jgi:alkylation response protein AidB-like acyl-CoA dehydrogenase
VPPEPESAADVVAAARALAPAAAEAAADGERERRLSPGLVAQMAGAGVFRLCVPAKAGGLEAHPRTLVDVVEALAQGDGAAGWCVAVNATSGLLAGYLSETTAAEVYADPRTVSGGVFAPMGRAQPEPGGYRVSGRWPFASGCRHCDWLMGGCVIEGEPVPKMVLAPASEFTIHDTWHTIGMRGTGSHDIEAIDIRVPVERAAALITGTPVQRGPLYAFPLFGLLAIAIGAVGLGIARGALDDTILQAGGRVPAGGRRTVAERPTAQADLAQAEARLGAARALLHEAIDEAWHTATTQGEVPVAQKAKLRLAATHAATTGADVTGTAYKLGGGSAVYETRSALPRRFRDANVATQHMLVAPATYELTGRLLMGLETDTTQL